MRYSFVKDHLPPNRYTSSAEIFQVLVDFVSCFTQLEAGVPQALLGFSLARRASCALNSAISSSSFITTALLVAMATVLFQISKWATETLTNSAIC